MHLPYNNTYVYNISTKVKVSLKYSNLIKNYETLNNFFCPSIRNGTFSDPCNHYIEKDAISNNYRNNYKKRRRYQHGRKWKYCQLKGNQKFFLERLHYAIYASDYFWRA